MGALLPANLHLPAAVGVYNDRDQFAWAILLIIGALHSNVR